GGLRAMELRLAGRKVELALVELCLPGCHRLRFPPRCLRRQLVACEQLRLAGSQRDLALLYLRETGEPVVLLGEPALDPFLLRPQLLLASLDLSQPGQALLELSLTACQI